MEQITRDYCKTLIDGNPCAFFGTNSCWIGNSPKHCYEVEQARQKAEEQKAEESQITYEHKINL